MNNQNNNKINLNKYNNWINENKNVIINKFK